jgi:hypothetical protein
VCLELELRACEFVYPELKYLQISYPTEGYDCLTNIAYALRLTLADVEPDIADLAVLCIRPPIPLQDQELWDCGCFILCLF